MKEVTEPKLCGECGCKHRPGENTCCPGWRPGPFVPDPPAEVQRYDEGQCGPSNMFPQPGGDWVKAEYFDAQKEELNEHRAELERARQVASDTADILGKASAERQEARAEVRSLRTELAELRTENAELQKLALESHTCKRLHCTADERAVLDTMVKAFAGKVTP